MRERWEPVLEGFYAISNFGRLKRIRLRDKPISRDMKLRKTHNGYIAVSVLVSSPRNIKLFLPMSRV